MRFDNARPLQLAAICMLAAGCAHKAPPPAAVSQPAPAPAPSAVTSSAPAATPTDGATTGKLLERYAGEWNTRISWQAPNFPKPLEWAGKSSMRLLGANWLVSHHEGAFLGNGFEAQDVTGYDAQRKKWTAVWADKMNDSMLVFEAGPSADPALTMDAEIVDDQGAHSRLRRHTTWTDDDTFVIHFVSHGTQGPEREVMTITASRAPATGPVAQRP